MSFGFSRDPIWYFEDERRDEAVAALVDYFERYTGSWFERLADNDYPNVITERDILAVSTLNVDIPASTTIWLLNDGAPQVTDLLSLIPANQAIWDPEADLTESGPAWKLWNVLRENKWPNDGGATHISTTKISKLLAVKRPNLIPVEDKYIRNAVFGGVEPANYWEPWKRLHCSEDGAALRSVASEVRTESKVPETLPILRVIDIAIWHWIESHGK